MLKTFFFIFLLIVNSPVWAASPPPVEGKRCMVVSGQHYATQIGLNILKQGGNAIDAAVAMGYALAVVYPCCGNIGGGGFMLIRFANGKSTFLNFREKAPLKIRKEMFLDKNGQVNYDYLSAGHITGGIKKPYLAVGIPGTVMGLNTALSKYGTLPLKEVMQPAILLAEQGFTLLPGDTMLLKTGESEFKTQPNVSPIFLKNGQSYQPGDKLIQKNLANTLMKIAQGGTPAFYEGSIADEIVKASTQQKGVMTKEDLKDFTVEEQPPITCHYKNYQLITAPPPGSGVTICEALKILELYPLSAWGFHAVRLSYADRNRYLGDPDYVNNPVNTLLSNSYIQQLRQKIQPSTATPSGTIAFTCPEGGNTTSYVVVDCAGNAVSVTYTLNDYFGAKVMPGNTGFFLNNEIADFTIKSGTSNNYGLFQGGQNQIAPGKRPLSSMSPTILTKDNTLFMVIGTPGGSTIPSQLINVILNVIDYGMNIQEAEDMPRFHMQWLPDTVFMEPFTFSQDTQNDLQKMGYHFHLGSQYGPPLWGAVTGIENEPKEHKLYGAMDSRRPAGAAMGE
jgi:gamma-glutamyltranspeptidase / glutathione hydrolase